MKWRCQICGENFEVRDPAPMMRYHLMICMFSPFLSTSFINPISPSTLWRMTLMSSIGVQCPVSEQQNCYTYCSDRSTGSFSHLVLHLRNFHGFHTHTSTTGGTS